MKYYLFIFLSVFCSLSSVSQSADIQNIQKDFVSWNNYQKSQIFLSLDFLPLDENSNVISKEKFLMILTEGNFIPVKVDDNEHQVKYQLNKILATSDTSIKATIAQIAFDELHNYKMEGKIFPDFKFADLDGNLISNETFKGKITVIKCWYIHCTFCIKEFPQVNQLAKKYIDRNDIQFISLAEDSSEQLNSFLKKKPLLYSVVPNMKTYMNEVLTLNAFPTHFILDKNGTILKVLSNYESLELALDKIMKDL